MHDPVGLDWLRLALRLDQPVPAEPVEYVVEVTDVQAAPLLADGLLEAALQLIAVDRYRNLDRDWQDLQSW